MTNDAERRLAPSALLAVAVFCVPSIARGEYGARARTFGAKGYGLGIESRGRYRVAGDARLPGGRNWDAALGPEAFFGLGKVFGSIFIGATTMWHTARRLDVDGDVRRAHHLVTTVFDASFLRIARQKVGERAGTVAA